MAEFFGYDGHRYLIAPGTNALALSCPDCGQGSRIPPEKYLSSGDKHTFNCADCRQVLFPVLEAHGTLWAECLKEWAPGFGEQVRSLRKLGVPVGRLKESPYIELHHALTEFNPVLGYSCGWLDKGQLDFHLRDEAVRKRVAAQLSDEDFRDARQLVEKRKRAALSSAHLVSEGSISNALSVMWSEAEALIALCVMLAQTEELARTGDRKHHSEIADLTTRCSIMRHVMTGKTKLPPGHTKLTYATDTPRNIAVTAVGSIKNTVEKFVKESARR